VTTPRKRGVKARKQDLHVVSGGVLCSRDNVWLVMRENDPVAVCACKTKRNALLVARAIAKMFKVEVVIHGRDGKIQDSDSYGHDPKRRRDRVH
jgi:hypothetical protein